MKGADMSEIKKCENCGNENIEIINRFKGHYSCGKCGRDTERLYEIEHDAEIRAKAIDDFVKEIEAEYDNDGCPNVTDYLDYKISIRDLQKIAEQLKGGAV